jgi:hypothetical protein
VSDAFDSIVPASPATRISTSMPVSALNSANASLSDVPEPGNESYVTSVTAPPVVGAPGDVAASSSSLAHAAITTASNATAAMARRPVR